MPQKKSSPPPLRSLVTGRDDVRARTHPIFQRMQENTPLTPEEEQLFQEWAHSNRIRDVDHPDSYYDYRGYFKDTGGAVYPPTGSEGHGPDFYKQHGHPTFSIESQYSSGPGDGGMWLGDTFLKPPPPPPRRR